MLRTCCLAALLGTLPAVMHAAGTPDYDTLQQNDTRRISGRVTDDTGKPLMGVTVVEKGTTNGVSTTADGSYTLRLQNAENAVLEFSFIGYRNTELPAGTKTTLDVQLTESVTTMDNVVVIGYGTTTKKELTGSVSSLKSDDFKQGNITNPLQLLQGQVAGLNIVRADGGDPNGDFEIQLRGMTTMAGGASPLVVIDGVVGGDLSNVSPDDIASIDVLKDGSAAAIYGTRGTNGVILVTTKKAHAGENRIEFSAYVAMQSVDKKPDVMSASEYRNTIRQYFPDKASSYDFGGSTGGDLSNVSPDDIASIDVLKDGSAAAIYGTRGTNGVILVTTKKAHAGENRIEFSAYVAMQSVDKKPDVMSASEYRNTIRQYFPDKASSYDFGGSTDWFDAVTRKHPVSQNYNVSSSGGSAKLNYRASVSYTNDIGLVKKTGNEKLRGRLNVSQSLIRDRLKVDYNFAYTTGKGSYADKFIMRQAVLRNPTEPIYETSGNNPQYGKYFFSPGIDYHNPVAMLEQRDDEGIRKEFSGSVNASLRIIDGLKISAMGAIIERSERYGHYYGRYYPVNIGNNGTAETYNDHYKNKMLEATIDYSGTFGDHKLQAIAGYSFSEESSESYDQMNYKFDTDIFGFHNIGSGGALKEGLASMGSSKEDNRLIAFFGRVMYNYKEKYLFSASVRYEGSSRFGDNHKWGTFPAVSLGWRISREPWLKDAKWLNELKLRAGFGITGNQEIGNYRSLSILRKGSSNFYYNKKWISTYEPGSNPNPDLRWEKKKEFNVGLDMSVLDNRLNVTVDYYNRRTKDLLYTYTVPVPPNLYPSKFANVGTIDNKGIEVTVNATPISRKNFSWNLAATISHNKNNLVKFSNEDYEMVQIQTGYFPDDLKMYTMRIVEGGSLGNFWGPKFLGFNDNGGAIYEDLDGVEGITEADYQVIGNAYPDVLLSLQNTFSYKQWSLSFLLRSSIGNDVLNQSRVYYEGFGYFGTRNILRSTLDHANYKDGAYYSSRFVEDGSYLKLDNITLSYDFKLKSKVISKLRCYVTAQNLFTITGYKGIDPEVSISGLQPGIDWYDFYPRTRTFVLGAAIAF